MKVSVMQRYLMFIFHYQISREKFEPEAGLELRPQDLYPGALPLSYPGSIASSPSNLPLEI